MPRRIQPDVEKNHIDKNRVVHVSKLHAHRNPDAAPRLGLLAGCTISVLNSTSTVQNVNVKRRQAPSPSASLNLLLAVGRTVTRICRAAGTAPLVLCNNVPGGGVNFTTLEVRV